jgi:cyclin-dependent kinase 10
MAREYSPRPLTPGVVTIWYRSPELLLGTSHYNPSVDLWSAGLILAELLLCTPLLPGDTEIQQLNLIVKLLGTPTPNDMAALSAMACPDLSRWRYEQLPHGRANNLERRFLGETTNETVRFLGGLLRWDPDARWAAAEALGKGPSRNAREAARWWKESPREVDRDLLPTFPEIRNGERVGREIVLRGTDKPSIREGKGKNGSRAEEETSLESYVFDFDANPTENQYQRGTKRHRVH